MTLVDTIALPLAQELVACLAVQTAKLRNPPENVGLRGGGAGGAVLGPNLDECCPGLAWVRITEVVPGGANPPEPQTQMDACGPSNWIVAMELGIARCVDFGSDQGNDYDPLTQTQWDLMTADQLGDFAAMHTAIQCCFSAPTHYVIGPWVPSGPEGLCMASTLTVQVLGYQACFGGC